MRQPGPGPVFRQDEDMADDTLLWKRAQMLATSATASSTTRTLRPHCTPFTLPSGGHLIVDSTHTITLTTNVVFTPECNPSATASVAFADSGISGIDDVKDPFYASSIPQVYATGAATVVAWMLVIMLMITPRTYFVGGAGGGFGIMNRHGMISGAQGTTNIIGVGSRPWLQKVAALTVAVSLTIATADTFKVSERQYSSGFMNAEQLRAEVVKSTEIKITRIISDIFLWLAQVQTLIRLFPRHKEKVLIKWIGFALIILDATFSCLNSFMGNPIGRPKKFQDAIPALSYLFQLALSMLYAAWVLYYAVCKRKYAFYHKDMWNITLVAMLSMIAILTPVVFFITDISNASVAGWGDYFRWVGAAAASVIVWEWVERIEALEREEKKDGILGREIFDGDDMLEPTDELIWPRQRRFFGRRGDGDAFASGNDLDKDQLPIHQRVADRHSRAIATAHSRSKLLPRVPEGSNDVRPPGYVPNSSPTPPPATVSPVSRADTASAGSTVYTVRYNTLMTPVVRQPYNLASLNQTVRENQPGSTILYEKLQVDDEVPQNEFGNEAQNSKPKFHIGNPFKRKRALPPPEVRAGQVIDPVAISTSPQQPAHDYDKWDIKGRLGAFAADHGEKWRERKSGNEKEKDLPVTIIHAQPRGRTWSPDATLDLPTEAARPYLGDNPGTEFTSSGPTAVDSSPRTGGSGPSIASSSQRSRSGSGRSEREVPRESNEDASEQGPILPPK